MKCCTGKVLRVDLTTGTATVEKIPDEVYEAVLSGKGLGAWYLYKNIPAGADPLGLIIYSDSLRARLQAQAPLWQADGRSYVRAL